MGAARQKYAEEIRKQREQYTKSISSNSYSETLKNKNYNINKNETLSININHSNEISNTKCNIQPNKAETNNPRTETYVESTNSVKNNPNEIAEDSTPLSNNQTHEIFKKFSNSNTLLSTLSHRHLGNLDKPLNKDLHNDSNMDET